MKTHGRVIALATLVVVSGLMLVMLTLSIRRPNDTVVPTLMQLPTQIANFDSGTVVPALELATLGLESPTAAATSTLSQATPDKEALHLETPSASSTVVPTVFPTSAPTTAPIEQPIPQQPVPNQIVIRFDPQTTAAQRTAFVQSIGGTVSQNIDALDTVVVSVPADVTLPPLAESTIVEASEPDYFVVALQESPANDPLYPQQWALPVIGAPDAWSAFPANAPTVIVAVIDSGICADHPDLAGRIISGWDFVEDDSVPQDDFGHGCAVSGVIAANRNDNIGIAGVAPNAQIMPLRVLNDQGVGAYSNVAAAIVYATDNGAQIINLSLGGSNPSSTLESAVNYAVAHGVMVIAAAGNNGSNILYPAAYEPVIAVGSIDPDLQRSSFSSYLPALDLLAPGRDILTTKRDGTYVTMSGTSFAAPHVAGVAAVEIAFRQEMALDGGIVSLGGTDVVIVPTETSTLTSTSTPVNTQSLLTYQNTEFNFSFLYPGEFVSYSWEPAFDILSSTSFYVDSPFIIDVVDREHEPEISVSVFASDEQISLADWVNTHSTSSFVVESEELLSSAAVFTVPSVAIPLVIDNHEAMLFSHVIYDVTATRLVIKDRDRIFSITYSNTNNNALKSAFTVIVSSFQLDTSPTTLQIDPEEEAIISTALANLSLPNLGDLQVISMGQTGYKLPWTNGVSYRVSQGWNSSYSHTGYAQNAYDFAMPEGSEVRAARGGTIANGTVGTYTACGGQDYANLGNRVVLNHTNDSDATLYLHLSQVNVSVGQTVGQGTLIGKSGKTGWTANSSGVCGPHLHFQRQAQGSWWTQSSSVYFDEYPNQELNWSSSSNPIMYRSQNGGGSASSCSNSPSAVRMFDATNCGGTPSDPASGFNWYDYGGSFNDRAKSIEIPQGWSVRLYLDNNESSASVCIPDTDSDLTDNTFSNGTPVARNSGQPPGETTSLRIYNNNNCSGGGGSQTGTWHAKHDQGDTLWWNPDASFTPRCEQDLGGPILDKNYGSGAPCGDMNGDNWVGVYEATLNFSPGYYLFKVDHDDGFKMWWVNNGNQNIADYGGSGSDWVGCPGGRYFDGNVQLKAILREEGGDARIRIEASTDTSNCITAPSAPSLSSPANNATINRTDGFTLSWNQVSGATEYYAELSGGPNVNLTFGWTSGTSWSIGAQWGGSYQWHVRAKNSKGTSDWSETRTLIVKYGAPSNLTTTSVLQNQVSLSWGASADATGNIDGYRIFRDGSAVGTVGSSTTTFTNTGLSCITPYTFTVKAYKGSVESDSSNNVNVTTQGCAASSPALNLPANGASINRTDSITLSWNSVSGATSYYAEFWGGPGINISSGWQTGTSWSIGSQWGGSYQWHVKARNANGESGWSSTRTLTVQYGAPSSLSANPLSGTQISLSWNASADAPGNIDGYRIYRNGSVLTTVSKTLTTYTDSGLNCATSYSYYVKAYTGTTESSASNTVNPTTLACGASAPTLNSPSDGASYSRSWINTLSWNSVSGATGYYAEFWGGPGININSGWQTGTSWLIGSQWGGSYQWRVKSRNANGESGWSATRTLTIQYGAPSGLTTTAISQTQVDLSWTASADAPGNIDGYRIYRDGSAIGTVAGSVTVYSDTGLSCNSPLYTYTVKAFKGSVESSSSNQIEASTLVCAPRVYAMNAYAADANGLALGVDPVTSDPDQVSSSTVKLVFNAGEAMQLYIRVNNNTGSAQTAFFRWIVTDPIGNRIYWAYYEGDLSTANGTLDWYLPATIPTNALNGIYNFTGEVTYNGEVSSVWTAFIVQGGASDSTPPTGQMTAPDRASYQRGPNITLQATASDGGGTGVAQVEFYGWSSQPWSNEEWVLLGTTSSNPPQFTWNVSNIDEGFLWVSANLIDHVGNESGILYGDDLWTFFTIDKTPPSSTVSSLPAYSSSQFVVNWSGSDNFTSTNALIYDIQYQDNGGSWINWQTGATTTSATFTGTAGHSYGFRVRATDTAGNVEAWPGTPDTTITVVSPPANDLFANARTITQSTYSFTQDVLGSTVSATDPSMCVVGRTNTVWFKYTPPTNLVVDIDTEGSAFDTVIGVYTGSVSNLTEIACDDDSGTGTLSWVHFNAQANTTYYIMVAKWGATPASQPTSLTLSLTGVPPTVSVVDVYTTDENGLSEALDMSPMTIVRDDAVSPNTVQTDFVAGEAIRLLMSVYNNTGTSQEAHFRWIVTNPVGDTMFWGGYEGNLTTGTGLWDWYLPTTIPDDVLTGNYLFTGEITYNGQTTSQSTSFHVTGPDAIYAINAYTTDAAGATSTADSPHASTADVEASAIKTSFSLGDPIQLHLHIYNNNDIPIATLFDWQVIDPFGRNVPTLEYLGEITVNPGFANWWLDGTIPSNSVTGTYTFIGSVIYNNQTSTFSATFHVQGIVPPANDAFGSAKTITNMPYTYSQDTNAATVADDDPIFTCISGQGHGSLWYRITPTSSGLLTVDTIGSDYDTVLAIWIGSHDQLQSQGCNDDAVSVQSVVAIPVTAGTSYYIEVAGFWSGARGTLQLSASLLNVPLSPSLNLPTSAAVVGRFDDIDLSWNAANTATEYYVEIWGGPGLNMNSGWLVGTSWLIDPQVGGTYQWHVKARNDAGESEWSATRTFYVKFAPPTNVSSTGATWSSTSLSWEHSIDVAEFSWYLIYRNNASVGSVSYSATTFTDTGLTCETTYTYHVKAYKDPLMSDASNVINVTTGPCLPVPSNLTFNVVGWTATLQWTDNSIDETNFRLERSYSSYSGWSEIAQIPPDEIAYTDNTINCGQRYYYRVRAYRVSDDQLSGYSNVVSVTLPACSPANAAPPRNYFTTATPTLTWNRVTGATEYEIQVDNSPAFTMPLDFTISVSANTLSVATSPLPDGTYYWRVRAKSGSATGAWSAVDSFVIDSD